MSSADRGACAAASGKLGRISGVIVLWLVLAVGALPAAVSAAPRAAAGPDLAGKLFTIAGALRWIGPSGGTPLAATTPLTDPAVAVTSSGDFLVADPLRDRVLRVGLDGTVSVVAGNGKDGFSGDGGPATRASLSIPSDVAALPDGGFLIDDQSNERIRRVWPDGHISTVAGNGVFAYSGDGGPATSASLFDPYAVASLPDGGFLIADTFNSRVRRVWPDGHISTVAGIGPQGGGDGRDATHTNISEPIDVAPMPDGGFLVADRLGALVWRAFPDGHISIVAGDGSDAIAGDGGPATSAAIGRVASLVVLPAGGFLIGSEGTVRRVGPDGRIFTIAGASNGALYGDGGPAAAARLYAAPQLSEPTMSLASLPDGGTLIGYGDSVHLLAGPPGTSMLTAAIRPGAGVAARRAYRARIVLSEPASITIRVYRAFNRPPVATMRAVRPAGESSVTIRLNKRVTAGLYALDLRAQRGSQATRAEQYVYLGGAVTVRSIRAIGTRVLADEFSNARNAYFSVGRCHQFNSRRVDCLTVAGGEDYIQASWLTRQGQLVVRTYNPPTRRHRPLFKLNPPWNAPPDQQDLGAAWNPSGYGALPPLDRFQ